MAERLNAPVLKTGVGKPIVSSNLTGPANYIFNYLIINVILFFVKIGVPFGVPFSLVHMTCAFDCVQYGTMIRQVSAPATRLGKA